MCSTLYLLEVAALLARTDRGGSFAQKIQGGIHLESLSLEFQELLLPSSFFFLSFFFPPFFVTLCRGLCAVQTAHFVSSRNMVCLTAFSRRWACSTTADLK